MHISNLKIGIRLGLGFGAIGILLGAVAFIGITRLSKLNDGTDAIIHDRYAKTAKFNEINNAVNVDARAMRNMILSNDPTQIEQEANRMVASSTTIDKRLTELDRGIPAGKGRELLKSIVDARQKYAAQQIIFKQLVATDKKDDAKNLLFGDMRKVQNIYFAALDKGIEYQAALMDEAGVNATEEYLGARNVMLILTALALIIAASIAYWITRSITRPMNKAVNFAKFVAAGDLSKKIESNYSDETGELLRALRDMNSNLAQIVGQVRGGTDSIATASGQIASGNLDLSSRTEQQASSLEETASSMEELASAVEQNSAHAREANNLSKTATEVAARGGSVVSDVVKTMTSINDSSKKIVEIISVIDGIAFQTNILALNAAVEAARAGEQGRGFAVVAAEVRVLAQRSATAAKEIKMLIGDSVEKVSQGRNLVDQAGATMVDVIASVRRVTDVMEEIATASLDQNSGIQQINQAITQMDTVTQQNAALVEQAAAAAQTMQEQSENLAKLVSKFILSNEDSEGVALSVGRGANNEVGRVVRGTVSRVGASVGVPLALARDLRKSPSQP